MFTPNYSEEVLKCINKNFTQTPLLFHTGSEKMNPVVLFLIGRVGNGFLGGFIAGIIHT